MHKKYFPVTVLILSSLVLFISGCGEDAGEESSASVSIPLRLSPAITQGEYTVEITISGSDMTTRVERQNLNIQPGSSQTHEITINNIPVGTCNIKVEVSKGGKMVFSGAATAYLSDSGANNVTIVVNPVGHKIFADFDLYSYKNTDLNNGGVRVNAKNSYDTHYGIEFMEFMWDWGDGKSTEFTQDPIDKYYYHNYSKPGTYTITLTVRNTSVNARTATRQRKISPTALFSLSIVTCRSYQPDSPWDSIGITSTFKSSDARMHVHLTFKDVSPNAKHVIACQWFDPNGHSYQSKSEQFENLQSGWWWTWAPRLDIKGTKAAALLGTWTVKVTTRIYVRGEYWETKENSILFYIRD